MGYDSSQQIRHFGKSFAAKMKSVCIPNEEVREKFIRAVTTGRHTEIAKIIRNSDNLLEAT